MENDEGEDLRTKKAAGIFVQCKDKILLLKRHKNDSWGETWGLPSGGVEEGEEFVDTAVRELEEEISLVVSKEELEDLDFFNHLAEESEFIYRIYRLIVEKEYKPELSEEHDDFIWVTPKEAKELKLIHPEVFTKLLDKFYPEK